MARKDVPVNTRNSTAHLQPAANSIYRCMKCSHLVLMLAIGAGCFETPLQMATAIAEAFPLLFVFNPSASRIKIFNSRASRRQVLHMRGHGPQRAIGCIDDVDSSMHLCLGRQALSPPRQEIFFKVPQRLLQTHKAPTRAPEGTRQLRLFVRSHEPYECCQLGIIIPNTLLTISNKCEDGHTRAVPLQAFM